MSTSSIKGLPPGVSLVGFDTPSGVIPNTNSRTQPNGGVASATYNGLPSGVVLTGFAGANGQTIQPQLPSNSQFVNQRDAEMYAQKQAKYNAINEKARQDRESGNAYQDIGTAAARGIGGRVAELGTGLRRLGALVTNELGIENNLDPNSPTYNPMLDRNSATAQLAKDEYFKVPKGTPGKAWATAYDVSSMATPGVAQEMVASKIPLAGKALGLLAGDTATGKGIASKVIGRNIEDIPGFGGYLANKAVGLGTNIIGGLAQTALKEGGVNKKDTGDIATGTLISSLLFSGLPALANGIRSFTKPEQVAKEFVESNPNKAEKVFEKGKQFIRDSLAKGKLKSVFGLTRQGKEMEDDALNVAVSYLPNLSKQGNEVDASAMYNAIKDDTGEIVDSGKKLLNNFPGDIYEPTDVLNRAKQEMIDERGGGHVGFLDNAYNKALKFIKEAAPKKQKISAKELHELIHNLSTYEFAGKSGKVAMSQGEVAADTLFKEIARKFRQLGRGQIEQDISAAAPDLGNKYAMINSEINSKLNAADIIEAISKNPTANKQFTDHMVGLLSGLSTGNTAGYFVGRLGSKLAGEAGADWRFNKTVNEPVFQEVARLRNQLLEDISKGKVPKPKGKLKLSDIINQKK